MDVPFLCQHDIVSQIPRTSGLDGAFWAPRSCSVACVTMVLNAAGRRCSMADVLALALELGGWDAARGWRHAVMVELLHAFGLRACRRNWRLLDGREDEYLGRRAVTPSTREELECVRQQMLKEGRWTIQRSLAAGRPVIASRYRPRDDRQSVGHQVVLLPGESEALLAFHDPAEPDGAGRRETAGEFFSSWKGTAIMVDPHLAPQPDRQPQ